MNFLKKISPILIIVLIIGSFYSFFHIDGREIRNVKKLSGECRATVIVQNETEGYEKAQKHELNAEQIEQLKKLLTENSYTRRLSSTLIGVLPEERYSILVDRDHNGEAQMLLYINIIGSEYIQFSGQFGDKYHKVKDPDFEKELISILEAK